MKFSFCAATWFVGRKNKNSVILINRCLGGGVMHGVFSIDYDIIIGYLTTNILLEGIGMRKLATE
jgi:hypothetical protein